jgi:membrane protein required for colicin V production
MVFDIIFLALFGWAAFKGFTKGFILQAASLAALILGIYGAIKFSGLVATMITENTGSQSEYLPVISFALTFIAIVVIIHFLARLLEKLLKLVALSFVNRIFGVLFNLIKYAFIISSLLVVINSINRNTHFIPQEKLEESKLYTPLSLLAPAVFPYLRFDHSETPEEPDLPLKEESGNEILV